MYQPDFFPRLAAPSNSSRAALNRARSGSFIDNTKLPVHRWFRYSAGFSAQWAAEAIAAADLPPGQIVFDPFVGSGTTLLAAQQSGIRSLGIEAHPFVQRIAAAKLCWADDIAEFRHEAAALLDHARATVSAVIAPLPLLARCYGDEALARLTALRAVFAGRGATASAPLLWLAITSILRECSGVGTAQWQYLLPNRRKARVADVFEAFASKIELMAADMTTMQAGLAPVEAVARLGDARSACGVASLRDRVGLVVTSPPYPNNYDYADATRLEMTFWGEVAKWSDLHQHVRRHLVTSCSQHSAADRLVLDRVLEEPVLAPIRDDLAPICHELASVRETHGGRKTYHTMIAAYFRDMAETWIALREVCAKNSRVCFVLGDSAPYGVHVPVEKWMARLALAAGFRQSSFEKLRDRNVKWKNRKHDVPLLEGRLWVEG